MYEYRVCQGSLEIIYPLSIDDDQHLLRVLAAFFYYHRGKALLKAPDVYQDGARVLEEQVKSEFENLKLFMKLKEII